MQCQVLGRLGSRTNRRQLCILAPEAPLSNDVQCSEILNAGRPLHPPASTQTPLPDWKQNQKRGRTRGLVPRPYSEGGWSSWASVAPTASGRPGLRTRWQRRPAEEASGAAPYRRGILCSGWAPLKLGSLLPRQHGGATGGTGGSGRCLADTP